MTTKTLITDDDNELDIIGSSFDVSILEMVFKKQFKWKLILRSSSYEKSSLEANTITALFKAIIWLQNLWNWLKAFRKTLRPRKFNFSSQSHDVLVKFLWEMLQRRPDPHKNRLVILNLSKNKTNNHQLWIHVALIIKQGCVYIIFIISLAKISIQIKHLTIPVVDHFSCFDKILLSSIFTPSGLKQ